MATAVRRTLAVGRWTGGVRTIRIVGLAISANAFAPYAQVRLAPDTPGSPLLNLVLVDSPNSLGVRIVSVDTSGPVPVSTLALQFPLNFMGANLPPAAEPGDDAVLAWELVLIQSDRYRQAIAYGDFVVTAGVVGADAATAGMGGGGYRQADSQEAGDGGAITIGNTAISVSFGEGAAVLAAVDRNRQAIEAEVTKRVEEDAALRRDYLARLAAEVTDRLDGDATRLPLGGGDMRGSIRMGLNRITGLPRANTDDQPVTFRQQQDALNVEIEDRLRGDATRLPLGGGTMTGPIQMAGNRITGLPIANTDDQPMRRKETVDLAATKLPYTGGTMAGPIDMGDNRIVGLLAAVRGNGAVTLDQAQSLIAGAIANLINGAPGALDTLAEIAAMFGNDPNYAASVTRMLTALQAQIDGVVGGVPPSSLDNLVKISSAALYALNVLANYPQVLVNHTDLLPATAPATGAQSGVTGFRAQTSGVIRHPGTVTLIEDWFLSTGAVQYYHARNTGGQDYELIAIYPVTVTATGLSSFPMSIAVQPGDIIGPRQTPSSASIATASAAGLFVAGPYAVGDEFAMTSSNLSPVTRLTVRRVEDQTPRVPAAADLVRQITVDLPNGGPTFDVWNAVAQSLLDRPQPATMFTVDPSVGGEEARLRDLVQVQPRMTMERGLFFNRFPVWGALANQDVTSVPFVMSMIRGGLNRLHAFCEGRENPGGDDVGMVIMEALSNDLGETWPLTGRTLVKDMDGTTLNRLTGPCVSYNPASGKTWIVFTWNSRVNTSLPFAMRAIYRLDSDGKWYGPNGEFVVGSGIANTYDLSAIRKPAWTRILPGPSAGVVAADGNIYQSFWYDHPQGDNYGVGIMRLNDADGTWTRIWNTGLFQDVVGESSLVALVNGNLRLNCRQRGMNARHIMEISTAGVLVGHFIDDELIDPRCQGSEVRLSGLGDGKPSRIITTNCADVSARRRITSRVSYAEGAKGSFSSPDPLWPDVEIRSTDILGGKLADPIRIEHTGGYTATARISDTSFAVLAQKNNIQPDGIINVRCLTFAVFTLGNAR